MSSILLAPGPETACPPVLPSFPVVKLSPPVEPPPVIDDAAQDDRLSFRSRDPEVIHLLVSKDGTTYELSRQYIPLAYSKSYLFSRVNWNLPN